MRQLAKNFDVAFPGVASTRFNGSCKVEEPENIKNGKGFQQIEFTGIDGISFPHELARKTSSFASIAQHKWILSLDCDGIILFEKNGQKYMIFCELKSTFSTKEIAKAKNQVIGSYVKMKGLFSTLQGYDVDDYKPVGIIVSFEPTQEQLNAISKLENPTSSFAITLNSKKTYHMSASKCDIFFHPFAVGNFDIYYIGVPGLQQTYSIDLNSIIK